MWPKEGYWNHGEVRPRLPRVPPKAMMESSPLEIPSSHPWLSSATVADASGVRAGCAIGPTLQPASFGTLPRWSDHRPLQRVRTRIRRYSAPPFSLFRVFFPPTTLGELPWWAMHVASRSILWLVCHWILQKGKDLRRVRRQHEEHHVRPLLFLFLGPIREPGGQPFRSRRY